MKVKQMHVEAMQEGNEKFYVVVDENGNFFAKSYSWIDATKIAALPEMIKALAHIANGGATPQMIARAAISKSEAK